MEPLRATATDHYSAHSIPHPEQGAVTSSKTWAENLGANFVECVERMLDGQTTHRREPSLSAELLHL